MPAIRIDATALDFNHFIIPGQTPDWVDANTVQTVDLPPGNYSYQIASGSYCDFTFTVGADGMSVTRPSTKPFFPVPAPTRYASTAFR